MEQDRPFDHLLREKAQVLLESLEQDNALIKELLNINDARRNSLYQQIGKITRGLHDAIAKLELNSSSSNLHSDAEARIEFVLDLTRDAANQTMDLAEAATPIAAELGEASRALRSDWGKLARREIDAAEFRELYKRIDDFLAYAEDKSNQLHENLTDIVVTQGYQDLSGQVLQQVMETLNATERDLVNLLAMAAEVHTVNMGGQAEPADWAQPDLLAEGPLPVAAAKLKSQDEVDDLLSDLGF